MKIGKNWAEDVWAPGVWADGVWSQEGDPPAGVTFSFVDVGNVPLSTVITSAPATVTGITGAGAITISGATYDINGSGTFVSTAGTVVNGDAIRQRLTSSASNSTPVTGTVTIDGVSDGFTVTTLPVPGEFSVNRARARKAAHTRRLRQG